MHQREQWKESPGNLIAEFIAKLLTELFLNVTIVTIYNYLKQSTIKLT